MDLAKLKTLFLKSLIGCVIAAAVLAVITVLIGRFDETMTRALMTILIVAVHCLFSFAFINNNQRQKTFQSLEFFTNAFFVLIVLSFFTAIAGIWGVVSGDIIGRLYALYFVLLFAVLHGEALAKTTGKDNTINNLVLANYAFMAAVIFMLMVLIFSADNIEISPFFYRLLAACGIVDATLTLIVLMLERIYVQKHPKVVNPIYNLTTVQTLPAQTVPGQGDQPAAQQVVQVVAAAPRRHHAMNIFILILAGYAALQILGGIGMLFFFGLR